MPDTKQLCHVYAIIDKSGISGRILRKENLSKRLIKLHHIGKCTVSRLYGYLHTQETLRHLMSKMSFEFGGMSGGAPFLP